MAQEMTAARPFATEQELFTRADDIAVSLEDEDWLEAFRAHPKIRRAESSYSPIAPGTEMVGTGAIGRFQRHRRYDCLNLLRETVNMKRDLASSSLFAPAANRLMRCWQF